eukprot:scaffold7295_cov167-Amphora_coffeaeformis.AAC.6
MMMKRQQKEFVQQKERRKALIFLLRVGCCHRLRCEVLCRLLGRGTRFGYWTNKVRVPKATKRHLP